MEIVTMLGLGWFLRGLRPRDSLLFMRFYLGAWYYKIMLLPHLILLSAFFFQFMWKKGFKFKIVTITYAALWISSGFQATVERFYPPEPNLTYGHIFVPRFAFPLISASGIKKVVTNFWMGMPLWLEGKDEIQVCCSPADLCPLECDQGFFEGEEDVWFLFPKVSSKYKESGIDLRYFRGISQYLAQSRNKYQGGG